MQAWGASSGFLFHSALAVVPPAWSPMGNGAEPPPKRPRGHRGGHNRASKVVYKEEKYGKAVCSSYDEQRMRSTEWGRWMFYTAASQNVAVGKRSHLRLCAKPVLQQLR